MKRLKVYHIMMTHDIGTVPVLSDQSEKEGKDQESIQSTTTPDTGYQ